MKWQMPETMRQAQRWEAIKLCYADAGLCDRCAAQAAWGHEGNTAGWDGLHPPCDRCEPAVRRFPVPTTNPLWRKYKRPQNHHRAAAAPTTLGNPVEETHGHHSGQEAVSL